MLDKKYVDAFIKMARHVPAEPTELQRAVIATAINHYMDGVEADLAGTSQGWSAGADYAMADLSAALGRDVDKVIQPVTPDDYIEMAVGLMSRINTLP